ncbi:MAG: histidine triad nucleotide-binding protein [Nitrospirota bacterium]|nr:histidine triad nucleotide-binding protein [Nitrospirota bacterium]
MAECIFCQIVEGAIPTKKLYEDDQVIAFDDLNPQARVHVLVIPKRHLVSLDDTQDSDGALLGRLMIVCAKMARERGIVESGYRVVVNTGREAGQTVFHLHLHMLGGRSFIWPPG